MSKFIITNKKGLFKKEVIEVYTPEEALKKITENTIQIREEYVNGMAVVSKNDLIEMVEQKN